MADLIDVVTLTPVTSARQNLINDYIQDGTHKINTLSIDIGGTQVITSARTLTNVTLDANATGVSVTNIDLTADITGILPVANGGTGAATQQAALDLLTDATGGTPTHVLTTDGTNAAWAAASSGFTDPMTTRGDIIYKDASNVTNRLAVGTAAQVLTTDGTDVSWEDAGGSSGGASMVYERSIEGDLYTTTLMPIVIPDDLIGKDVKEVRIALSSLPTGAAFKVDVRKSGTASTDSIFTSDTEIEIGTGQSATNGIYMTGCDSSGSTVGTSGTTINSSEDTLAADDVLWIVIVQCGSTLSGTDFVCTVSVG